MSEAEDAGSADGEANVSEEVLPDPNSTTPNDVRLDVSGTPATQLPTVNDPQRSNPCIYRVPLCYRKPNPDAYTPQVVSFGPYHHKCGDHLLRLEAHKEKVLDRFLEWRNLDKGDLLKPIREVAPDLMSCYDQLEAPWTGEEEFALLMARDGIFVLALLEACARARNATADANVNNNAGPLTEGQGMSFPHNDPVFSKKAMKHLWPYIQRDMILFEDQIPLMVLRILLNASFSGYEISDWMLHKLVMDFLKPQAAERVHFDWSLCSHFLDVYRDCHIKRGRPLSSEWAPYFAGTARALHARGISIRLGRSDCFDDIEYVIGAYSALLCIPRFEINETAECTLLNLLAQERLCSDTGDEVVTFVLFMERLFRLPIDCLICWVHLDNTLKESCKASDVVDYYKKLKLVLPPVVSERFMKQKLRNWSIAYWPLFLPSVIFGSLKMLSISNRRLLPNTIGFLVVFVIGYFLRGIRHPSGKSGLRLTSTNNSTTNG